MTRIKDCTRYVRACLTAALFASLLSTVPAMAADAGTFGGAASDNAAAADALTPSLDQVQKQVDDFANSPDYRFAPTSTAKARAMLAAASLAEQRHDAADRNQGIRQAEAALENARQTAADFRNKYTEVLKLESAAVEAAGSVPDPALVAARDNVSELIRAFEQGHLNDAAVLAGQADKALMAVLRDKMPAILQQTDAALLKAERSNAKRYTPATYGIAKQWLADALAWNDGLNKHWPAHPLLGLKLANRAADLAEHIMKLRRKPDSYETLMLKARDDRLAIAAALGLKVDTSDPGVDVDNARLVQAIRNLRDETRKQQQAYQKRLTAMEAQYQLKLGEKTDALRNELSQQQDAQMSQMKEAFRAKLERETFESRRQKQLGELFKQGEVEILANVDGSILIRLSSLQFASGKTGIDKKYYDLLSKLQKGLDLYPDRKVVIEGHTDNRGDPKMNQQLSLKRAETVRDFLVAAGMDASRLKALGYGEVRPIASNDYERGRAMNRRIDVIIQAPSR